MNKQSVRDKILEVGIVPVVRASSVRDGRLAAGAIQHGGVPVAEITMTVPGALDLIRELAKSAGADLLLGAGTVVDAETARRCVDAGAQFIVSPGLDLETVRWASQTGVLIIAGALSPTEVIAAWKAGADLVKVFPCGQLGGAKYIQALKAPLPQIPLVPTGGVNLTTAADFLLAGAAALGVGSELVSAAALKEGRPEVISENARKFAAIVKETRARMAAAASPGTTAHASGGARGA